MPSRNRGTLCRLRRFSAQVHRKPLTLPDSEASVSWSEMVVRGHTCPAVPSENTAKRIAGTPEFMTKFRVTMIRTLLSSRGGSRD